MRKRPSCERNRCNHDRTEFPFDSGTLALWVIAHGKVLDSEYYTPIEVHELAINVYLRTENGYDPDQEFTVVELKGLWSELEDEAAELLTREFEERKEEARGWAS